MTHQQIILRDVKYENCRQECPYEIKKKVKYVVKFPEDEIIDDVLCPSVDTVHRVLKYNKRNFSKTMVYNYFSPKRALVGKNNKNLRGAEIYKV